MRKTTSRRLESIHKLRGILTSSRSDLEDRLRSLLAEQSGASFSYRQIFDHLEGELIRVETKLTAAEEAYDVGQLLPPELRRQREQLAANLHERYESIRQLLAGAFARRYGTAVTEPAPRSPRPLIRHVRLTSSLLHCLRPDSAAFGGVEIDPTALAAELDPRAEDLEELCNAIEIANADVVKYRDQADRALVEADGVVTWVARSLEGFYHLAGLEALAERIRVASRR